MRTNFFGMVVFLGFLAGCQDSGLKPIAFPDQSGNKKGKGLFSKSPNGFVITGSDISGQHPLLE